MCFEMKFRGSSEKVTWRRNVTSFLGGGGWGGAGEVSKHATIKKHLIYLEKLTLGYDITDFLFYKIRPPKKAL